MREPLATPKVYNELLLSGLNKYLNTSKIKTVKCIFWKRNYKVIWFISHKPNELVILRETWTVFTRFFLHQQKRFDEESYTTYNWKWSVSRPRQLQSYITCTVCPYQGIFLYRPLSISSLCELVRNYIKHLRMSVSFITDRYFSFWNTFLKECICP